MSHAPTHPLVRLLRAAAAGAVILAAPALAQPTPQRTLADLLKNNDRLLYELDRRDLETLRDHAFDKFKISPEQRAVYLTTSSLRQLSKADSKLTLSQKEALVRSVAAGIDNVLTKITASDALLELAAQMVVNGIERPLNTLEYWGDNPRTQALLEPVARAVSRTYATAAAAAKKEADDLANRMNPNNVGELGPRWERLMQVHEAARYSKLNTDYALCLSLERDKPERATIAGETIRALVEYEDPERGVHNVARILQGKLFLARGGENDFAEAQKKFEDTLKDAAATWAQRYEATYFHALADVLRKDPVAARKSLDALRQWQKANPPAGVPDVAVAQKGIDAATRMFEYRVLKLEADVNKDAKANEKAVEVLLALVREQPNLQSIVFEQLKGLMPENPDLTKLDPLFLRVLVGDGEQELRRPPEEKANERVLRQALGAAEEIIRRNLKPEDVQSAALLRGFFLDRMGGQDVAAANAFLDYLEKYRTASQNLEIAYSNAAHIVGELWSDPKSRSDPAVSALYERFLAIAIAPPLSKTALAFEYAFRLLQQDKPKEAAEVFDRVPASDKRILYARYYQMLAYRQMLAEGLGDKALLTANIQRLADDVSVKIAQALPKADAAEQARLRSIRVKTLLSAADLARRQGGNGAQRAVDLLKDFEAVAEGVAGGEELEAEALFIRVNALMALGKNNQATENLVVLLNKKGGMAGAGLVFNLLTKLNEDLEAARKANDRERVKQLADNRAVLSGFLVEWAEKNPDPKIKSFTYRYKTFDAATKQLAGELEQDPTRRRELLEDALKRYQELQSPENVALYRQVIGPGVDPDYPDPVVLKGLGDTYFELGDYGKAQPLYSRLLDDRKLGTPRMTRQVAPEVFKEVWNDQYWEGMYRLLFCNAQLIKSPPPDVKFNAENLRRETIDGLTRQFIFWGQPGGPDWAPGFVDLWREMAPDQAIPSMAAAVPATQPGEGP